MNIREQSRHFGGGGNVKAFRGLSSDCRWSMKQKANVIKVGNLSDHRMSKNSNIRESATERRFSEIQIIRSEIQEIACLIFLSFHS